MSFNETDTRAKLIDPALHTRGWTENLIRREETAGAIEIVDGKPRKRARGGKRALLSPAAGAGKTFIAVQLLKKIADAGQLRRALFVCDRNELRSQALAAFQNVFGADAAELYEEPDDRNRARNVRIHIATYQTLDVDNEDGTANFLTKHYPPDYFSHIIIDECHRSVRGQVVAEEEVV